jgi:hypothetical protein
LGDRRSTPAVKRLILLGEEYRQNALRDCSVSRIFGAVRHVERVVINFPVDQLALEHERTEVLFAVGVIVFRKIVKRADELDDCGESFSERAIMPAVSMTCPPI